jgi:hypothetical protein
LSLFWEPRWVRKKLIVDGIEVITCVDEVTKLILCPICENIDEFCPEGRQTSKVRENLLTFFTSRDLVYHLRSHKYLKKFKFKVEKYEEAEEVEEEGEEEE